MQLAPLLLALTPLAPLVQEGQGGQDAGPTPFTFAFDWPARGEVEVRESRIVDGRESRLRYSLRWAPNPPGTEVHVRTTDVVLEMIGGIDDENPLFHMMAEKALPQFSAIPVMRISPQGELLGFHGTKQAIQAMLESLAAGGVPAERIEELKESFRDPQVRELVLANASEGWTSWVGTWIDYESYAGELYETAMELPSPLPDETLSTTVSIACEGLQDGVASMRMTTVFDPDDLTAATLHNISLVGEPAPEGLDLVAQRTNLLVGTWEVATLRPHRVESETRVTIRTTREPGGEPDEKVQLERRVWEFAWK